jgi:hypothetical protein
VSGSRIRRTMAPVAVITCLSFGLLAPARGETLEQIEGLSIVASWKPQFNYINGAGKSGIGNAESQAHFYISTKGNIFFYHSFVLNPGQAEQHFGGSPRILPIDKAGSVHGGKEEEAWSVINGHLTQIISFVRSFGVTTFMIDPVRLTCTFDKQFQPDPQTGTTVTAITGERVQILNYKVVSYTCDVKRGNVFATTLE